MKTTFVIISVSDRVHMLNNLIESIMADSRYDDYDINLLFQDYAGNRDQIAHQERYANIFYEDTPLGCHLARVLLLNKIRYDVYINLDDDIELGKYTNYTPAIEKALEPSTGFVLTNWARTQQQLEAKIPNMQDKFVKQILIYQGGGMIYGEKIAELMRDLPQEQYRYDDIWSLTAYINGYQNYRYLNSLAVHKTLAKGGMNKFMRSEPKPLACAEYINYRLGKSIYKWKNGTVGKDTLIGIDSDCKPIVKELHEKNKK